MQSKYSSSAILIDGAAYPSVTRILTSDPKRKTYYQSRGLHRKQTSFDGDGAATGRHRGTSLHEAFAEYMTTGHCDVPPIYYSYWEQLQSVISSLQVGPILWAEAPMLPEHSHFTSGETSCIWSTKHKYLGKPDLIASLGGVPCVWEIKTSRSHYCRNYDRRNFGSYGSWFSYAHSAMQTSAYAAAWNERTGADIHTGVVINVMPDDAQLFIVERTEMNTRFNNFKKLAKAYHKQS